MKRSACGSSKGELTLTSELPGSMWIRWIDLKHRCGAGTKRAARTSRPWYDEAEDLYWSRKQLEMLVRYPKRESHRTASITRALLLSMELYLYVDDDGSWHRPSRNGGGVLTKEDAMSAIVQHCTGFQVGGNALRRAATKTYGKLVGGSKDVKRLSWAKNIRKNVPNKISSYKSKWQLVQLRTLCCMSC